MPRVPAQLHSGEDSPPGLQTPSSHCVLTWWRDMGELSGVSYDKDIDPIISGSHPMTSSNSNYLFVGSVSKYGPTGD